jgi:hypothetical protein
MEVSGQFHVLAALPPGKSPQCPLNRRLSGPQSRSSRREVEKNFLPLSGTEPRQSRPWPSRHTELGIPATLILLQ